MKIKYLIPLLFLLAAFGLAQDKPKKSELNVVYDKIEDRTNVSTPVKGVRGSAPLQVLGYLNHQGKVSTKPITHIGLAFYSWSSNWKYLHENERRLFVLAGDERFALDSTRGGTVNTGGYGRYSRVSVSEQLIFAITVEELDRILNTNSLEMKIREEIFTFDKGTLQALRELSEYAKRHP